MDTASRVFHRPGCRHLCLFLVLPCILLLVGCGVSPASSSRTGCSSTTTLNGAGSTFDAPLFNKLFMVYPTFTHYLAAVSPAWKAKVGAGGTSVTWPKGVGEQGSQGVIDQLVSTEGSIGYVEWSYVVQKHLSAALIQNAAGAYLAPSIAGAQAAAASFQTVPADLRFYVVNGSGSAAYPITGYSWVIVYRKQNDAERGKALAQLLWWMIHGGQQYAEPLQYAPLPTEIVTKGEAQVRAMICDPTATPCFTK